MLPNFLIFIEMSALTTPFIHTNKTIDGVVTPVNVENVAVIDKVTIDASSAVGSRATYEIIFTVVGHGNNPKEVRWRYDDETVRDDDFDGIVAAVSSEVVPAS